VPYLVYEGSVLDTVLMNRLDGDAAGSVKVLVSNPLYSHDHQHVIIPEGTVVLGEAKKIGGAGFGQQRRMAVVFHRLIMPDGYSVDLDQFHGLDQIGEANLASVIAFKKTSGTGSNYLENIHDYVLWFAKDISKMKYRQPLAEKSDNLLDTQYTGRDELRELAAYKDPRFMPGDMSSQGASEGGTYPFPYQGVDFRLPANTHWKASRPGMPRLSKAARLIGIGQRLRYRRYADDFSVVTFSNSWDDTIVSGYSDPKVYVVQTSTKVIQRCILMATDPGDLARIIREA